MDESNPRHIGKTLFLYLSSAWMFIEAINFLIDKYSWHTKLGDGIILLVIFGLPAAIIYAWFHQEFTKKAILFQLINGLIAISVIGYSFINPDSFDTSELRLLKFKKNQKELAKSIRSIAILPFDNYTGDENQEHIILGLHDALINELGQLAAIRVISKTSSSTYVNSQKTVTQIASELKVDGIIEASVFSANERIGIQLKLINVFPEEQQLWSQTFDTDMSNTLNLYRQVVKNIAKEIQITLSSEEQVRLDKQRSINPDAYRAYIKSQTLHNNFNTDGFTLSLQYLDSALAYDPNYLDAYLGIAHNWIGRAQMGLVPYAEAYPKIKEAETKALALNIQSSELHNLLATIRAYEEWHWEQAEIEFEKAIALNPNNSEARQGYSYHLAIMQEHEESRVQIELALELDPFNPFIESFYAWNMIYARQYEEAIVHSQKSLELASENWVAQDALRQAYHMLGRFNEALDMTKTLYTDYEMLEVVEAIDTGFELGGYKEALRQGADALVVYSQTSFVSPESIAEMYNYAGEKELALDWLEKAYEIHDPEMHYLAAVPVYDNLREESRFEALIKKMNFPPTKQD